MLKDVFLCEFIVRFRNFISLVLARSGLGGGTASEVVLSQTSHMLECPHSTASGSSSSLDLGSPPSV